MIKEMAIVLNRKVKVSHNIKRKKSQRINSRTRKRKIRKIRRKTKRKMKLF